MATDEQRILCKEHNVESMLIKVAKRCFALFRCAREMSLPQTGLYNVSTSLRNERRVPGTVESHMLYAHPLAGIYDQWETTEIIVTAEISDCVMYNGMGFAESAWNPFVEVLKNSETGTGSGYEGSVLASYYAKFQPANALEAFNAGLDGPMCLREAPAYAVANLHPWGNMTPAQAAFHAEKSIREENIQHAGVDLGVGAGYNHHGPVEPAKGNIEYRRLRAVFESIRTNGYCRDADGFSDVKGFVLKRGDTYRYHIKGGLHRLAALAALRYPKVPVRLIRPVVIRAEEVEYWPQVRTGLWDRDNAVTYFNHLFDFDAYRWARANNLAVLAPLMNKGAHSV